MRSLPAPLLWDLPFVHVVRAFSNALTVVWLVWSGANQRRERRESRGKVERGVWGCVCGCVCGKGTGWREKLDVVVWVVVLAWFCTWYGVGCWDGGGWKEVVVGGGGGIFLFVVVLLFSFRVCVVVVTCLNVWWVTKKRQGTLRRRLCDTDATFVFQFVQYMGYIRLYGFTKNSDVFFGCRTRDRLVGCNKRSHPLPPLTPTPFPPSFLDALDIDSNLSSLSTGLHSLAVASTQFVGGFSYSPSHV